MCSGLPCNCPRGDDGRRTGIGKECIRHWGHKGIGHQDEWCCCLSDAIFGRLDTCDNCPTHGVEAMERVRQRDEANARLMALASGERLVLVPEWNALKAKGD